MQNFSWFNTLICSLCFYIIYIISSYIETIQWFKIYNFLLYAFVNIHTEICLTFINSHEENLLRNLSFLFVIALGYYSWEPFLEKENR